MPATSILPPFAQFTDRTGEPLQNGYIYIGSPGLDAQTNPITAYWDDAFSIPAAQPIRTTGGYPYRNGTPARVYVPTDFSITVLDGDGAFVYGSLTGAFAGGGSGLSAFYADRYTATAGQTTFTLTTNPASINALDVSVNGSTLVPGDDFTWVSTTVTLTAPLVGGERVLIRYTASAGTATVLAGSVTDVSVATGSKLYNRINDWVSVKDFGAVGDGVTDDTAAIQAAINYCVTADVRRLQFESNHVITDINVTKKYYCGLILEGANKTHQPSTAATIIVTGASSQGIDISGTSGVSFKDLTIRGDATAPPRCAIFASRVSGAQESAAHSFDLVSFYGSFTKAAVYNFAGELWTLNSLRIDISGGGYGAYFTSYNSLGLASKFQTPDTSVTPMTCTWLSNASVRVSGAGIAGLWFEQDPGSPPDATLQGVYIKNGYYTARGGADCSIKLTEVTGNVVIDGIIDESFATGDATSCTTIIKQSGARTLRGLSVKNSVFYGRTYVLDANSVQDYFAENNYVWNPSISWRFSALNNAHHETLFENELFNVTSGTSINVVPVSRTAAANIIIPSTRVNRGFDNKYLGSPLNNVNPERRDISVLDSLHARLFTAVGTGDAVDSTSWREVVTKQLSTAVPTSGSYAAGQLVFNSAPNTSTNRVLGFIATTAGTMGSIGAITATTTAASADVVFSSTTGLSVGSYISIVGVTGTKQIVSLSGLNATLSSVCDASVTAASVALVAATFYRVGPLNILSAASSQTVSLAAGATTSFTISVTGAEMGDFAQISYSTASVGALIISGAVTSGNTVTVSIYNPTAGTINTGTGNWWALVTKR